MSAEVLELLFSETEYFPVPVTTLSHRKIAFCDMYVRLPSDRMVRVAHRDGAIDMDRFNRLLEKKVSYIFVHKDDYRTVVSDLVRGVNDLIYTGMFSPEDKIAKCFSITECICSELLNLEVNDQSMARVVHMAKSIAEVLKLKPNFGKTVSLTFTIHEECTRHALGTVVLANLIASNMDWKSDKTLETLTLAAFVRDIGFREIPRELRTKDPATMTREEWDIYKTHPELGAKILKTQAFIPGDVIRIVEEHHELPSGKGYPLGMKGERMSPMSKVVSFAEMLNYDIEHSIKAGKPLSVPGMLKKLEAHYTSVFGIELTKAARKIFKP